MSRVTSVSIATGYGLDGLVIEYGWGRDFLLWVPGVFQGVKRSGRDVDNTSTSSVEVKTK